MTNNFTGKPRIMSDDLRRRMHEKNMAIILNASGPDTVAKYWDKDWHELNVYLDALEERNDLDGIQYYIDYAESDDGV
jgi:hypothetical protein